jgi:hypothetical protein
MRLGARDDAGACAQCGRGQVGIARRPAQRRRAAERGDPPAPLNARALSECQHQRADVWFGVPFRDPGAEQTLAAICRCGRARDTLG